MEDSQVQGCSREVCGCDAGGWRNGLLFDPLKKYGNFSYTEIMLNPLADAMAAAATSGTNIYFAMQA
jgi:hypothetical protein